MLTELNKIFVQPTDMVICKTRTSEITQKELFLKVIAINELVEPFKGQRCLIDIKDPFIFLSSFFSLLSKEITIILSANTRGKWLDEIYNEFDFILCESGKDYQENNENIIDIGGAFTGAVDYEIIEKHKKTPPQFSGNEKIYFFTSGSTGKAKKIEKTLNCLTREVKTLDNTFPSVDKNTLVVSSVSHLHIYGLLFNLILPFITGKRWHNSTVEFQEQIDDLIGAERNCTFISSPAFLSRLDDKYTTNKIGTVFSSGGLLSKIAAELSSTVFNQYPTEVYGSTESGGIAYRQQLNNNENWQLFDNIFLTQNNENVELSSVHIKTNNTLILDDQIELKDKRQFVLLGRKDRIVKIEEKRVSLGEIENFVKTFDFVDDCVALLIPGKRSCIGCVLVLSDDKKVINSEDKGKLSRHIAKRMKLRFEPVTVPRKWRILSQLPMNSQSKLDTITLKELFG